MVGVDRAAQGDGHLLAAREPCHKLSADALKTTLVNGSIRLFGVESLRLDTELLLGVLLVAKDEVAAFHEGRHNLSRGLAIFPKVLPVVEVAGHEYSKSVRGLYRLKADIRRTLADRRSDTGPMEPVRSLEDLLPIDHSRLDG